MNCSTDKYDLLYARYLDNPGKLLDFGEYDPKKHHLMDICGGSGAVAKEAIRRGGTNNILVDINPYRAAPESTKDLLLFEMDINEHFHLFRFDSNFYVCRQALGYIDIKRFFPTMWDKMKMGDIFVFNTFKKKPKGLWNKKYTLDGKNYQEYSLAVGDRILHLQKCNMRIDFTTFKFHSKEKILSLLGHLFAEEDIVCVEENNTLYFKVTKSEKTFDKLRGV